MGPQHSCTRLIVGLIDRHPDIKYVHHMGTNEKGHIFDLDYKKFNKIVVVSRDSSSINKSNEINKGISFNSNIAEKTVDLYKNKINQLINNNICKLENIFFISVESLVQYKELILKKLLLHLELDITKYDFNLTGEYQPKEIDNVTNRWFKVNLDIVDPNKKYFIMNNK
jgi:hypothetical protein